MIVLNQHNLQLKKLGKDLELSYLSRSNKKHEKMKNLQYFHGLEHLTLT